MTGLNKISYYDLALEAWRGRLPELVGRRREQDRLTRIVNRKIQNNCLVVGAGGIGKTALVRGWMKRVAKTPKPPCCVELEAESFHVLDAAGTAVMEKFEEAIESLPPGAVFIDDFGTLVYNRLPLLQSLFILLEPLLESPHVRVVLALQPPELDWMLQSEPGFRKWFEIMNLKNQPTAEQVEILQSVVPRLAGPPPIAAPVEVLQLIVELTDKFSKLGQLPRAAINILDESLAHARARKSKVLEARHVYRVVADKTGVPMSQLAASERGLLKNLESRLSTVIVGQGPAIRLLSRAIQRAKLGLKNARRPLGSFLFLGPSGVGKTETARQLAEQVFGRRESFVRLDMSEFGQEHTVQRLLGAPPGYVGYDAGGYLTNAVRDEPHSLILLDEIEKAHPKAFDIFLQILDDGRLTSGQGETVDFSQTIIIATSNVAVPEILAGWRDGLDLNSQDFLHNALLPALSRTFRLEFLNRFDALAVFKPLSETELLAIAKLEIKKVEMRAAKHHVRFRIDPAVLRKKIASLADPRFGARPVKRFIEETCESLVVQTLLK